MPRRIDPDTVPKRYCKQCGHKLAAWQHKDIKTCFACQVKKRYETVPQFTARRKLPDSKETNNIPKKGLLSDDEFAYAQELLTDVCDVYQFTIGELCGKTRDKRLTEAREAAVYLLCCEARIKKKIE